MRSIILLLFIIGFNSCNECTNCTPFTTEPYIKLHFLNAADSTNKIVIIDSVNHEAVHDSKFFEDTTYSYRLPLNMNFDESLVALAFRDTSNINIPLTGTLNILYERQFERRDDNYIIVDCFILNIEDNFPIFGLYCNDSTYINCRSNDVTAQIYL